MLCVVFCFSSSRLASAALMLNGAGGPASFSPPLLSSFYALSCLGVRFPPLCAHPTRSLARAAAVVLFMPSSPAMLDS